MILRRRELKVEGSKENPWMKQVQKREGGKRKGGNPRDEHESGRSLGRRDCWKEKESSGLEKQVNYKCFWEPAHMLGEHTTDTAPLEESLGLCWQWSGQI
jgi:hypothetical protein